MADAAAPVPTNEAAEVDAEAVVASASPLVSRLGLCAVCGSGGRYRCPRCGASSCSLACVGAHKAASGCSGRRDVAAFASLKAFTDDTLRSDLALLEETQRGAERAKRARLEAPGGASQGRLPAKALKLQQLARSRGTEVLLQAPGMSRRCANSSKVDFKTQGITWHVEWRFPSAPALKCSSKVSEETLLRDAVSSLLRDKCLSAVSRHALRHAVDEATHTRVFLEKVGVPASTQERWVELDRALTLKAALAGKWLFEFPTLHVALPAEVLLFPLAQHALPEAPPAGNVWI